MDTPLDCCGETQRSQDKGSGPGSEAMKKYLSTAAIQRALTRLADPDVNSEIYFASTINVAKDIIRSLPGVRRLRRHGPEVAQVVLTLLQQPKTLEDEKLVAISLEILEAYPSEGLKIALAKPIVERRFRGINSMLAAETFLKAAGIEAARKDAIAIALREAKKIVGKKPVKIPRAKRPTAQAPKTKKKPSSAVKK